MKKVLSVFLCLAMVLATAPFTVSAIEAGEVLDSITIETITTETADFITGELTLPNQIDGYTVTWTSNNDAIVVDGERGIVTPAGADVPVTLTATVDGQSKEIPVKVAAQETEVIYQSNFKQNDFKYLNNTVGTLSDGVLNLDFQNNSYQAMYTFPTGQEQSAPFYVQFYIKSTPGGAGIDFRLTYGSDTVQTTLRFEPTTGNLKPMSSAFSNIAGAVAPSPTKDGTTVLMYIDPMTATAKFLDGNGDLVPANGLKLGSIPANSTIKGIRFCRAGSSSPAGAMELDNLVIYRDADLAALAQAKTELQNLAKTIDLGKMTEEEEDAVTTLDFTKVIAAAEAIGADVEITSSDTTGTLTIVENVPTITRGNEDVSTTLTLTFSKGNATEVKTFDIKILQRSNPAKQAAEAAVQTILSRIGSQYAVTGDINLDLAGTELYGATVSFSTDADATVFSIDSGKKRALVMQDAAERKDVTLTVTASCEEVDKVIPIELSILPRGTSVLRSEGFTYPEFEEQSVTNIPYWTMGEQYKDMFAHIKKAEGNHYLEHHRTGKTTPNYDHLEYDFSDMRKPTKATVEWEMSFDKLPDSAYYDDIMFETRTKEGSVGGWGTDQLQIRMLNGAMSLSGHTVGGTSYSKTLASFAQGDTLRMRMEFDFTADTFDIYVNDTAQAEDVPFKNINEGEDVEALSKMRVSSYATEVEFKIGFDNFTVYTASANLPDISAADEFASRRPLEIAISKDAGRNIIFDITSDYDENQKLKQRLFESNVAKASVNPIVDFNGAWFVNKNTGNETSLMAYVSADETAPFYINGMYIGSNHGAHASLVTANAHGKTYADIGSIWQSSSGKKYCLVRIIDENKLMLLEKVEKSLTGANFVFTNNETGTFTNVSGGVNTGAITVTAASMKQLYAVTDMKHTYQIVRDGVKTEISAQDAGKTLKADELIITETYSIMDPYTIDEALAGGSFSSDILADAIYNSDLLPDYEPLLSYKQIITVKGDGTIVTEVDHQLLKDVKSIEYYGYQYYPRDDIYGGGVYRHIPGMKAFSATDTTTNESKTYDYSVPQWFLSKKDGVYSGSYARYTATSSSWNNSDIVPSRIQDFIRDTSGKNVLAYMTGFLPVGDGAPNARKEKTTSNIYFYGYGGTSAHNTKAYPKLICGTGSNVTKKDATFKGASYRRYEDLTAFKSNNATYYSIEHEGKVYYYIDFLAAGNLTIDLENKACIYNLAELEKNVYGDAQITFSQAGDIIEVTSTGKGYLVLSAEKKVETVDTYYDAMLNKVGVKFVNHTAGEANVNILVASYKDGRMVGIIKDANTYKINGNSTLLAGLSVASLAKGDSYKLFVLDSDNSIAPITKDVLIDMTQK